MPVTDGVRALEEGSPSVGTDLSNWLKFQVAGPDARIDGNRYTAAVEPDQVSAVMAELVRHEMSGLTVTPASLEDLFLRHYDDAAVS